MSIRLYTIEADGRPHVVMSAGTMPPPEDGVATKPKLIESIRFTQRLQEQLPSDIIQDNDLREIEGALATWLGADLRAEGRWSGERELINIRVATAVETENWHSSLADAVEIGEQDAGNEDWVLFLV